MKKIQLGFWIVIVSFGLSGCSNNSTPCPDKIDKSEMTFRATDLNPYSTPSCMLDPNTVECDYLNMDFDIDASKTLNDTMIFWETANPQNTIKVMFQRIIDQDGVYEITIGSFGGYSSYNKVNVEISGNKLGTKIIEKTIYSGNLYFKTINGKYDIVICDGHFEYYNGVTKVANFNAHFTVPK